VRQDWRFDIRYEGCNPGVAAPRHLFLLFTLFLAAAFAASASFMRCLSPGSARRSDVSLP